MSRINNAFLKIKEGQTVTRSAFEQGYESLSGFSETFKNMTGFSPGKEGQIITINRIPTPLGPMMIGVTDEGLVLLEFTDRKMIETQLDVLKRRMKAELVTGKHPMIDMVTNQLNEYFEGKRKDFDVPLVVPGTEFQQKVWDALIEIPLRYHPIVQATSRRRRGCQGGKSCGKSEWRKSYFNHYPLPQDYRF